MNDPRALPGEPLALDLVDSEFALDGTVVDLLATAESARAWAAAAGLTETLDEAGISALRQARAAIRDALEGRGTAPLNAVLDKGRVRLSVGNALAPARTLQAGEPAWQPAVLAAANLLDLLDASPDRVKHCENPDCVLWFFDTTRNGTRRWCSMAVCGNRMKARRHYDRVKARLPVRAILEGSKAGACVIAWFALLCFVVPRGKGLPCRGMARSVRCRVST
jgi:predicted RNA-binding Zn ribbon-like protein